MRMGPHPMTGVLIRREKPEHRDTDRQGESSVKMEAEVGGMCVQAKAPQGSGDPQKLERGNEQTLPQSLQKKLTLLTP